MVLLRGIVVLNSATTVQFIAVLSLRIFGGRNTTNDTLRSNIASPNTSVAEIRNINAHFSLGRYERKTAKTVIVVVIVIVMGCAGIFHTPFSLRHSR